MKLTLLIFIISLGALGADYSKLESFLFNRKLKDFTTEQFILYQNGELKYEKFEKGNQSTRHLLWSMSKSVGALLFGAAQDRGFINKSDPVSKYYKDEINKLPNKQKKFLNTIKLEHLLEMSSGFDWNEFYEKSPFNSHVVRMLYFSSKDSAPHYVLKTLKHSHPGKRFHYSSGDSNLLMGALGRSLPKTLRDTYPWEFLFDKLEIDATFERDAKGNFLASSYVYMSTSDLLKLGIFVMNKGMYKGKQVISKDYMKYVTTLNNSFNTEANCEHHSKLTYGAQFWLNAPCPNKKRNILEAPKDLVMMLGHGGQSIFIFPSQKIVAVRVARDKGNTLDKDEYVSLILSSLGIEGDQL